MPSSIDATMAAAMEDIGQDGRTAADLLSALATRGYTLVAREYAALAEPKP